MKFIDLGQTYDSSPMVASERKSPRISYPSLCICSDEEIDIPKEGSAMMKFRRVEKSENERDPEDTRYRYELEVMGIGDVKEEEADEVEKADPVEALEISFKDGDED